MSRAYPTVQNGDVVQPKHEGYKMQCCDCGLVHKLTFKVWQVLRQTGPDTFLLGKEIPRSKALIQLQAYRDNRATAMVRRHKLRKVKA